MHSPITDDQFSALIDEHKGIIQDRERLLPQPRRPERRRPGDGGTALEIEGQIRSAFQTIDLDLSHCAQRRHLGVSAGKEAQRRRFTPRRNHRRTCSRTGSARSEDRNAPAENR
jgi:hypothetical protein